MVSGDSISNAGLTRRVGKGFSENGVKESLGWYLDGGDVVCEWFGKGLVGAVNACVIGNAAAISLAVAKGPPLWWS